MAQHDSPEQLLDVFKAAALSVTKLYKTSALAESRARSEGYQDCIEDLLSFLDKEDIGLCDGEGWRIRRWATERLNGRNATYQHTESEDDAEKTDRHASPEMARSQPEPQTPALTRAESPSSSSPADVEEPYSYTVPSQENFTFESSHPYPNIATLDLSDPLTHDPAQLASRAKALFSGNSSKRPAGALGRGAGAKRRMDFDDFFGGCLGKDVFPGNGKRGRHA